MAISFVGSASNTAANGGDVGVNISGLSLQEGDLVIVAYAIGDNDNVDETMAVLTSGYSGIADLFSNDTQDINLGVFYKFMGATPDTSVGVDGLGGTDASTAAVVMAFRGVDATTPFDVTSTTATGINTAHPDPPSIDHNGTTGIWTVIAAASGHTGGTTPTYTFPTGYATNAIDDSANDTSDCTVGLGYNSSPSDPENPGALTYSGTDSTSFAWCAVTMALRPAAAAALTLTADAGSYAITGTAANLERHRKVAAGAGSYAIAGTDAGFVYDRAIVAGSGSYAITGTAANLEYNRILSAAAGSYAVSGTDATLRYGKTMAADAGSYAITGTAASLEYHRALTAAAGSYAITGTAASLEYNRLLTAGAGSYALSGAASGLLHDRLVTAGAGSYALSGTAGTLLYGRLLTAASGSYAVNGTAANIEWHRQVLAGAGSYQVTGAAANLEHHRVLAAGSGTYTISGTDVTLTYTPISGAYTLTAEAGAYAITGTAANLEHHHVLSAQSGSYAITGVDAGLAIGQAATRIGGGRRTQNWQRRKVIRDEIDEEVAALIAMPEPVKVGVDLVAAQERSAALRRLRRKRAAAALLIN